MKQISNKQAIIEIFWIIISFVGKAFYDEFKVFRIMVATVKVLRTMVDAFREQRHDRITTKQINSLDHGIEYTDILTNTLNIVGFGSNSGRLYNHADIKLLKESGGSQW